VHGPHPVLLIHGFFHRDRASRIRAHPGHLHPHSSGRVRNDHQVRADRSHRGESVLVVVVADGRRLRLLTDALAGFGYDVGQLQPG